MLKVLEANELPLETKRERIEFELKADPSRGRRIARRHQRLVAKARKWGPIGTPA